MNHNRDDVQKELLLLHKQFDFDETSIDKSTLLALREGDHQAYKKIYYTYKEPIEYFLIKLLRSEEDAAELTQIVFVNLWEKRESIDPSKSIKSYLFSIAKNSALDYFRHLRVQDRYVSNEMKVGGMEYESDEAIIAAETRYIVEIAVSRMPPKRRKVFEMSRLENMSNDEIAKKLNMNKLTVASHIAQAVKEIREVLALFYILFIMS